MLQEGGSIRAITERAFWRRYWQMKRLFGKFWSWPPDRMRFALKGGVLAGGYTCDHGRDNPAGFSGGGHAGVLNVTVKEWYEAVPDGVDAMADQGLARRI